jgi:hypothetical protein
MLKFNKGGFLNSLIVVVSGVFWACVDHETGVLPSWLSCTGNRFITSPTAAYYPRIMAADNPRTTVMDLTTHIPV